MGRGLSARDAGLWLDREQVRRLFDFIEEKHEAERHGKEVERPIVEGAEQAEDCEGHEASRPMLPLLHDSPGPQDPGQRTEDDGLVVHERPVVGIEGHPEEHEASNRLRD